MEPTLGGSVPADLWKLGLTLGLALLLGLQREERKQRVETYAFGGVRTFPLIGLVSYALALLSGPGLVPWSVGLAVVGALMFVSFRHKIEGETPAGATTEVSALAVFVLAALVQREHFWIATTVGATALLLLELKKSLEGLSRYLAPDDVLTATKFLVLAGVILPILPDASFTRFAINPFKTWLVVVAVSGVSFASYLLQRLLVGRGGVMLSAILGGAYSSTVTTVALARQAKTASRPKVFAGSILMASGVMYIRLVGLVALFNPPLALRLAPGFALLAVTALAVGWTVASRPDPAVTEVPEQRAPKNPLELRAALLFAIVFVGVLVLTSLVRESLGHGGLFTLAAVMGFTDVDPFILGVTQSESSALAMESAAGAIMIAAASNNFVKAIYAYSFADRATGRLAAAFLGGLAVLGVVPLAWL